MAVLDNDKFGGTGVGRDSPWQERHPLLEFLERCAQVV